MRWPFGAKSRGRKDRRVEIHPDEILADASNLPEFNRDQMEGRLERPLSRRSLGAAALLVGVVACGLLLRSGELQIVKGGAYAVQARENQLAEKIIFADRGLVLDRQGRKLAWNDRAGALDDFPRRMYAEVRGLAHAVGYVKPPVKDSSGFYFRDSFVGVDGAERVFDADLAGTGGLKLTETNARGEVVSEAVVRPPAPGATITLSVDAQVNQALYDAIAGRVTQANFQGGAGVVMDVRTGELLALTSFPEYSSSVMTDGEREAIAAYNSARQSPFLNRAVDGLYAPGSIVKPVMAAAALAEGVIDEHKEILSEGQISVPNPYDPSRPTIFKDWRVNGWTDMREAIAVSSDVYFYAVGGGYQGQPGLGIQRIDKYLQMFGFGADAGLAGFSSKAGSIPTPEWKAATFPEDPLWRIGNTYHTSIGQYGTTVTPLQAARMTAAVANGGVLLTPTLLASSSPQGSAIAIDPYALQVAREGMRLGVTSGIATAVNVPYVAVAAKTGTAQVGARNEYQNAWMIGFWPFENPRFAYAVVLERAPAGTTVGGSAVMRDFFTWLNEHAPEYLQ